MEHGFTREWMERNWRYKVVTTFLRSFAVKESKEMEPYLEGNIGMREDCFLFRWWKIITNISMLIEMI